jgi:hypothetical protein
MVVVSAARKTDDLCTLWKEEPVTDIVIKVHDLGRSQELLLRELEHRRFPFRAPIQILAKRVDR